MEYAGELRSAAQKRVFRREYFWRWSRAPVAHLGRATGSGADSPGKLRAVADGGEAKQQRKAK